MGHDYSYWMAEGMDDKNLAEATIHQANDILVRGLIALGPLPCCWPHPPGLAQNTTRSNTGGLQFYTSGRLPHEAILQGPCRDMRLAGLHGAAAILPPQ